jgi:2-polyprenyl-3-methyl-5-hydroxy-6-metoxy-1,4-benzoquinol methylase
MNTVDCAAHHPRHKMRYRASIPELMDAPGLPPDEVAAAYRVLRRVNRQFFGANRVLRRELDRWRREDPEIGDAPSLLDVGSGSGDLPELARRHQATRGMRLYAVALDRDPVAARLARESGSCVRGDALRLPFRDRAFDVVTAAKFAHHFEGARLVRLLGEMARVARRCVLVLDIRRSWLAYAGFVAWSRVFTTNRLVRHDGPVSVRRGFDPRELSAHGARIAGFAWTVRRYAGFQLVLAGRRLDD